MPLDGRIDSTIQFVLKTAKPNEDINTLSQRAKEKMVEEGVSKEVIDTKWQYIRAQLSIGTIRG